MSGVWSAATWPVGRPSWPASFSATPAAWPSPAARAASAWVRGLLERGAALDTPHSRRFRQPASLHVHPHARLLIVDFDHAQRQGGLESLRADLERGLDRSGARSDIHCLGDAGNISFGTFFSGL
jgi:hypothetical protein